MHFGIFGLTRNQKTFGGRAPPGPAGEAYTCAPQTPSWIFGEEGKGREEEGDKRREGVDGKGKEAAVGILREGRHVAKYGTVGEYRLG